MRRVQPEEYSRLSLAWVNQLGQNARLFRVRKRASRPHGTIRRERVGLVEAVKTRGKLLLSPGTAAETEWKEVRQKCSPQQH